MRRHRPRCWLCAHYRGVQRRVPQTRVQFSRVCVCPVPQEPFYRAGAAARGRSMQRCRPRAACSPRVHVLVDQLLEARVHFRCTRGSCPAPAGLRGIGHIFTLWSVGRHEACNMICTKHHRNHLDVRDCHLLVQKRGYPCHGGSAISSSNGLLEIAYASTLIASSPLTSPEPAAEHSRSPGDWLLPIY
jgi:hypothetical protein